MSRLAEQGGGTRSFCWDRGRAETTLRVFEPMLWANVAFLISCRSVDEAPYRYLRGVFSKRRMPEGPPKTLTKLSDFPAVSSMPPRFTNSATFITNGMG